MHLTIEINEQQEAKIMGLIQRRRDFKLDGGQIHDGEKLVFLKSITFEFHEGQSSAATEERLTKRELL